MEGLLDQIGQLLRGIFAIAEGGFDGVNQVLGLIIAAVAAVLMASWGRLFPTALAAALVHMIITVVRPVPRLCHRHRRLLLPEKSGVRTPARPRPLTAIRSAAWGR